jgi:hypothetical protein
VASSSQTLLVRAEGDVERLTDETGTIDGAKALEVTVAAVRTHLRQSACEHGAAPLNARYCPACGTPPVPSYQPDDGHPVGE